MSIRETVLARRAWFVPGLVVYGVQSDEATGYLVTQQGSSGQTVYYATADFGEGAQVVAFASLSDHRGNQLPAEISTPRVIVRPRSTDRAYIVREESNREFTIARDVFSSGPVTVDLLIMEMGA